MTPEQKILFDQLTQLQQRVATNVLAGMSQRAAYFEAGGTAASDDTADVMASRMISTDKVKAFMDSMKMQAVNEAIMGREEMLARLSLFARKGIKDIVKFKTVVIGKDMETGEDLQQTGWWIPDSILQSEEDLSIISELEVGKNGPKIKTHSALQAMAQISRMQGYDAAQKSELTIIKSAGELSDDELAAIAASAPTAD